MTYKRFVQNSLSVPGPEVNALCEAARSKVGALWNTNLLIGADGTIVNHHRKLVPTFYEKLIWAPGDGAGLQVCDTPIGKLGMLICGENTNPLARYSFCARRAGPCFLLSAGVDELGRYDLASAIRIRAGAHSFEGKLFNIVSSAFLDKNALDALGGIRRPGRLSKPAREV